MKSILTAGTVATALLVPGMAQAKNYTYDGRAYYNSYSACEKARKGRISGGVIGGIAGALIGDNLSGSEDEGAAIGGVVGALVGSEIGARVQRNNCYRAAGNYKYTYRDGVYYRSQPAVLAGDPRYRDREVYRDGRYRSIHDRRDRHSHPRPRRKCGYGQRVLRAANGRIIRSNDVYMCKRRGGQWRIVDRPHHRH